MNKQELETYIDLLERTVEDYQLDIEDKNEEIEIWKDELNESRAKFDNSISIDAKMLKQRSNMYEKKIQHHMGTIEDLKEALKKKLSDDFIFGLGMGLLLSITVIFGTFWVGVGQ